MNLGSPEYKAEMLSTGLLWFSDSLFVFKPRCDDDDDDDKSENYIYCIWLGWYLHTSVARMQESNVME